jgi:hypothetical protein
MFSQATISLFLAALNIYLFFIYAIHRSSCVNQPNYFVTFSKLFRHSEKLITIIIYFVKE